MLDSRYIHLHEALGLGVMWLNQNAKIIESTKSKTVTTTQPSPALHAPYASNQARLATLALVRNFGRKGETKPTKTASKTGEIQSQSIPPQVPSSLYPVLHSARLMVMSVCASMPDVAAGRLFSGQDGILLNKMIQAIKLTPDEVYYTTWLKDLPDFNPYPPTEWVKAAQERVAQEWQQTGAKALLLLGDFFIREDVQSALNDFCPRSQRFIIAHPLRIVSNPQLKRGAWEILQSMMTKL